MKSDYNCIFCRKESFYDRLIFESDYFFLILDQNPVIDNHYLLVSKKHVTALGYLNTDAILEVKYILDNLQNSKIFNSDYLTVFERGNKHENKSDQTSIDHTHLHLFNLKDSLFQQFPLGTYTKNFSLLDLQNQVRRKSYFTYGDIKLNIWKVGDSEYCPSQYIRKFISEANGLYDWNWRSQTISKFKDRWKDKIINNLKIDSAFAHFEFYK